MILPALVFDACSGSSPGSKPGGSPTTSGSGQMPPDPTDPGTGRWYGTITVTSTFQTGGTTNPAPGTTTVKDHLELWKTNMKIDVGGGRHTQSKWRFYDYQKNDIVQSCIYLHGTNLIDDGNTVSSDVAMGYFALVSDGPGRYRSAELAGVAFAMPTLSSHNSLIQTGCAGATSQQSIGTETPGLQTPLMLDQVKGTLSPDAKTAAASSTLTINGITYALSWNLKRDKDIVADPGGPYEVTRGQQVMLDASASRGDITSYKWTLTPSDECKNTGNRMVAGQLSIGKLVNPTGKQFAFVALCDVNVHLDVEGPAGTDGADTMVLVDPRKWNTNRGMTTTSDVALPDAMAGTNRCAKEGAAGGDATGHYIHHDPTKSTWDGVTYTTMQIAQSDSPFAGAYYINTNLATVARTELVNTKYLSGGTVYAYNAGMGNQATMDALGPEIRAHESAHTTLLMGWLDFVKDTSLDAARGMESFAAMTIGDLERAADLWLTAADEALCSSTVHPLVWAILMPNFPQTGTVYLNGLPPYSGPLYMAGQESLPCEP